MQYVDLSGLDLEPARFVDGLHVDPEGRERITRALVDGLRGDAPEPVAALAPPTLRRDGTAARSDPPTSEDLARFELAAAAPGSPPSEAFPLPVTAEGARDLPGLTPSRTGATALWVYPGTTVRVSFPDADGLPVAFSALAFGGTAPPVIDLPTTTDGALLRGAGTAPDGPWELGIASPPDGPWLLVRTLAVGETWVVGTEATSRSSASLLAGTVSFAGPAPPVAQSPAVPGNRPGTAAIAVELPPLDLDAVTAVSPLYACSPVAVAYRGAVLRPARRPSPGRSALVGDRVLFASPEGADVELARARAILDPDRRCERYSDEEVPGGADRRPFLRRSRAEARWLYPGDVATFRATLTGLHASAGTVEVRAFRYGPGRFSIVVRAGGEVVAEGTVDAEVVEIPVSRPVGPEEAVEVEARADGFVQLVGLRLVEGDP